MEKVLSEPWADAFGQKRTPAHTKNDPRRSRRFVIQRTIQIATKTAIAHAPDPK